MARQATKPEPATITATEAAALARVNRDTIYRWGRTGRIPKDAIIHIGRTVRINRAKFLKVLGERP